RVRIAEALGLAGSARGGVLGVEEEDHFLVAQVLERDLLAVARGQLEIGGLASDGECHGHYTSPVAKKEKPFNNPFGGVRLPQPPSRPAPKAADPPPARPPRDAPLSEEELWSVAVDGAKPLADRSGRIKPQKQPIAMAPQLDPELEAYDEL